MPRVSCVCFDDSANEIGRISLKVREPVVKRTSLTANESGLECGIELQSSLVATWAKDLGETFTNVCGRS